MRTPLALTGVLLLQLGCEGSIARPTAKTEPAPSPAAEKELSTSPQLRRLSRAEYRYTVADLFNQPVTALAVPLELSVRGHSAIAGAQKVGYDDTGAFLDAAERVADTVAASVDGQLGPCNAAPCTAAWVSDFLARAFRGPVDPVVVARYAALLASAEAGDTRLERVKTFILAALNSPHFLYRKELGAEVAGSNGALRALTGPELAARLSYLVWQSLPDAELTNAGNAGSLADPATRQAQLSRLLSSEKAKRGYRAFVRDWMALNVNRIPGKAAATLAGTPDTFAADAEASVELLVDDVVGAAGGSFAQLLSTDRAYVNASLAPVLGLASTSATLERVQLADGKRLGILSQPLVLSAHSKESGVSPFILGKFILENVTCEEVGNPPAMFPSVSEVPGSSKTLRQDLEERTAGAACASCHSRISPVGFAFLPFDPIGRYSPADGAGRPFDTAGSFTFQRSKAAVQFADSAALGRALAQAPDLQRCVARRLFRLAHGRFEATGDEGKLLELEDTAVSTKTLAERLLREVVTAEAFAQVPVKTQ